jgi:hypothetical protein
MNKNKYRKHSKARRLKRYLKGVPGVSTKIVSQSQTISKTITKRKR